MSLELYFVAHQTDVDNYDWLVWANSRSAAVWLWQHVGIINHELGEDPKPTRVFKVPAIPTLEVILKGPHAMGWWDDVKIADEILDK